MIKKKQRVSKLHPPTGGRNLIGRRTQSDRTANAICSDGVRYTMAKRNKQSKKNIGRVKTTVLR